MTKRLDETKRLDDRSRPAPTTADSARSSGSLESRRVLILRPRAAGGLLAHCRDEHRVLARYGALIIDAGPSLGENPIHAAEHCQLPFGAALHPWRDLRTVHLLRRVLRRQPGIAVHAHGLRSGAVAVLARVGLRRRGRLVTTLHNRTSPHGLAAVIGRILLRIAARGSDLVLGVSPDLVGAARRAGARAAARAVIPGARTTRPTSDRPQSRAGEMSILVPARLAPQKGLSTLLDALMQLPPSELAQLRVCIAGDGPEHAQLEQRIRRDSLPVTLLGFRRDLPELLTAADVVVQSSVWEGQPVALQEAIHAGCAIVATDAGGTRWVTSDAALLVPTGDPAALATAISRVLDPAVREDLRDRARARSAQLPGDEQLTQQLVSALWPTSAPTEETR